MTGDLSVVVLAKEPVPGLVKTRLQAAFSPQESALLAAAAIEDTLDVVRASGAARRVLAWQGTVGEWGRGFAVVPQPTGSLNARLTAAFADAFADSATGRVLLIGMDTPQVTVPLLASDWRGADAVLGLSEDGGFWAIGLRRGHPAAIFDHIPMSTDRTGSAQLARLLDLGLTVTLLPPLRDIDLPADAEAVAYGHPWLRFARTFVALQAARPEQGCARLFDRAYAGGSRVEVDASHRDVLRLDVARWSADADAVDDLVVRRCEAPVIDLGCGPGRMVRALGRSGRAALGVDISAVAVETSVARGGPALRREIDAVLPAEGRWGTALLMDGNVGIGGDVGGLLGRCRRLVAAGGLLICEVDAEPDRHDCHSLVLRSEHAVSLPVPWARIGTRALERLASLYAWRPEAEWSRGGRWFVALRAPA